MRLDMVVGRHAIAGSCYIQKKRSKRNNKQNYAAVTKVIRKPTVPYINLTTVLSFIIIWQSSCKNIIKSML